MGVMADGLQRHAAHFLVERFVDFTHATAAEHPDNLEAVKDDFTNFERQVSGRINGRHKWPVGRSRLLIVSPQQSFELRGHGLALLCADPLYERRPVEWR
jgi:hypothetical protein